MCLCWLVFVLGLFFDIFVEFLLLCFVWWWVMLSCLFWVSCFEWSCGFGYDFFFCFVLFDIVVWYWYVDLVFWFCMIRLLVWWLIVMWFGVFYGFLWYFFVCYICCCDCFWGVEGVGLVGCFFVCDFCELFCSV